jgi:hypothetical protein
MRGSNPAMLDAPSKTHVRMSESSPAVNDNVYPSELRTAGRADRSAPMPLLARSRERVSPWAVMLFLVCLVLVGLALPYI